MQPQQMHVLLTGATGGIGQATALQLAAAGARILAVGRQQQRLNQLLDALPTSNSAPHHAFMADLSDPAQHQQLLSQLQQLAQPPNVLINMAGLNQLQLFEDQDPAMVERIIALNLTTPMRLTQALLPILRKQPEAQILNVGSTFGSIGYPGYVSYCSSKFGLRGFTEALRRELADSSIRVQYFAPRATRTPLNSGAADALNQRLGSAVDDPEQVARALVALLANHRSQRYLGWPERLFVRLNGLLPELVSRAIAKQLPVIKEFTGCPSQADFEPSPTTRHHHD